MCLFNFNNKSSIKAKIKGIDKFECGHCPECLQKKSRQWALRCGMEAKTTPGVMITLTYDTYKVDKNGNLINVENPIDPTISLNKKHCQDFIKRLRKHFDKQNIKIKYLLTAERGKKGRAHYHALIFGAIFPDLIKYKKSDRGNWIYKSKTLTDIWKRGICTVDCINLSAKTARYCTKYCSKDSGAEETFMLFSRGIGEKQLLKEFNGRSYWIDGREYSIPKQIWQKVIEKRYKIKGYSRYINRVHQYDLEKRMDSKFNRIEKKHTIEKYQAYISTIKAQEKLYKHVSTIRNFRKESTRLEYLNRLQDLKQALDRKKIRLEILNTYPYFAHRGKVWNYGYRQLKYSEKRYNAQKKKREIFEIVRDNDEQYKEYLKYWQEKNRVAEITRPSELHRILALPNNKYRSYKNKALQAKIKQYRPRVIYSEVVEKYVLPSYYTDGSKSEHFHVFENRSLIPHYQYNDFIPPRSNCSAFLSVKHKKEYEEKSFAHFARHYRANDTEKCSENKFYNELTNFHVKKLKEKREKLIQQGLYTGFVNNLIFQS